MIRWWEPRPPDLRRIRTVQKITPIVALAARVCLLAARGICGRNLNKVNHIIIVMQENHSQTITSERWDRRQQARTTMRTANARSGSQASGRADVQGHDGVFHCANANLDDDGSVVPGFKATSGEDHLPCE